MANTASSAQRRIGVIDLGSNTVLLLVLQEGGRVVADVSVITRLGRGVFDTERLDPSAVERTRARVAELSARARELGAERVVGVGTEALRRATDGERFLAGLLEAGWLDAARLLSGKEEAAFSIESARRAAGGRQPVVVIDVGGGSTELAWTASAGDGVGGLSLPLGSVRLTERRLRVHPVPPSDLEAAREEIREATRELCEGEAATAARGRWPVAVAGTATTLAALDQRLDPYSGERVEGYRVSRGVLSRWIALLARLGVEERRALPGLEPARADVIVAGLLILDGVGDRLDSEGFHVSERGVRHGVALRLLEANPPF